MKPRINVITLGVGDLVRARRFYCEGLGWMASSTSDEHIVFIDAGGVVLGLYPRDLLAEDAKLTPSTGFGGVTLAQNAASKAEVDAALKAAVEAGGILLKPAADASWGRVLGLLGRPRWAPVGSRIQPILATRCRGQRRSIPRSVRT